MAETQFKGGLNMGTRAVQIAGEAWDRGVSVVALTRPRRHTTSTCSPSPARPNTRT
jgi:hypothetical protein